MQSLQNATLHLCQFIRKIEYIKKYAKNMGWFFFERFVIDMLVEMFRREEVGLLQTIIKASERILPAVGP